jgi:cytochrome P450
MVAGSDTTSNAIIYILHHLSLHPDTQEKLRAELVEAGGAKGELGYDDLAALPFLDAVVRETLRLYVPFFAL